MMTSREIVLRTIEFEGPERVARTFGESDLFGVECTAKTHATRWTDVDNGKQERVDEWGNIWHRLDRSSKGEVKKGALDSLDDVDKYEFPDYSKPEDYEVVKKAKADHPDKWIMGLMPGFAFNIARKLRRLDLYLMDLVTEPQIMSRLHDRVDEVLAHMIENYAKAGADSVFFLEDWGTQQQLMINPKLWRQEFFPRYKKHCDLARECGTRVFMHSCGNVSSIVPGIMDSGVQLLQFDQPELYGLDRLASYQERGKITFWCPVDIQTVLQTRDEKIIRAKSREMLQKLWKGRGGFIAGYYEDNLSIGLDPQIQSWASDEFFSFGLRENFPGVSPIK